MKKIDNDIKIFAYVKSFMSLYKLIKEISTLQKYWKEGPLPVERPTDPLILKQAIRNIVLLLNH